MPATFSRAQVSRTGFYDNPTLLPRIEYSAERKPGRPLSLPQEALGRQPRLTGMFQVSQRLFSPKPHHLTSPLSVLRTHQSQWRRVRQSQPTTPGLDAVIPSRDAQVLAKSNNPLVRRGLSRIWVVEQAGSSSKRREKPTSQHSSHPRSGSQPAHSHRQRPGHC